MKEDEDLRYTVMGLIGINDLRSTLKTLTGAVRKLTKRLNDLTDRINSLAEAQVKTEEAIKSLTKHLNDLTDRINSLAEAQVKTEEAIKSLTLEVSRLSDTIGFSLEDIARVVIPDFLYRHEGVEVSDLERKIIIVNGEEVEVNLYGEGFSKNGRKITVIGEVKSRIYSGDVVRFDGRTGKLVKVVKGEMYKLMFGYLIHPVAEEEARRRGVKLIASYMR
ncbi:MAG: hypothetical protein QXP91_04710 [Candidatus Methanomethylicia archaeon]